MTSMEIWRLWHGNHDRLPVPVFRPVYRRDTGHHHSGICALAGCDAAGIDPIVFAIIGIVSLAFGLVTPPYGLCLLISAAIGQINVVKVLPDVLIILAPMLLILILIILFPEIALWLPTTLMPDSFK